MLISVIILLYILDEVNYNTIYAYMQCVDRKKMYLRIKENTKEKHESDSVGIALSRNGLVKAARRRT